MTDGGPQGIARRFHDAFVRLGARHLFEVNLTRLAVRRGTWLRGYAYAFVESFAPTLTREAVQRALAGEAIDE